MKTNEEILNFVVNFRVTNNKCCKVLRYVNVCQDVCNKEMYELEVARLHSVYSVRDS